MKKSDFPGNVIKKKNLPKRFSPDVEEFDHDGDGKVGGGDGGADSEVGMRVVVIIDGVRV